MTGLQFLDDVMLWLTGICVADPLQVRVFQSVSLDVPLPYSVVRGEQIELKGSVYNNYESRTKVGLFILDFYFSSQAIV